jgi:hypothetical protein
MINIEQPENLKSFAEIMDGKVVNVSLWTEQPTNENLVEIPKGSTAGIDWDYIDGEFVDNRPPTQSLAI